MEWLYYKRCCRVWPLAMGERVGKCGYCGEVPKEDATREQYELSLTEGK